MTISEVHQQIEDGKQYLGEGRGAVIAAEEPRQRVVQGLVQLLSVVDKLTVQPLQNEWGKLPGLVGQAESLHGDGVQAFEAAFQGADNPHAEAAQKFARTSHDILTGTPDVPDLPPLPAALQATEDGLTTIEEQLAALRTQIGEVIAHTLDVEHNFAGVAGGKTKMGTEVPGYTLDAIEAATNYQQDTLTAG